MRGKAVAVAALLGTTALTPTPANAGPVIPFLQGIGAAFGLYGASGAAVAAGLGGAAAAGATFGAFISTSWIGQTLLSIGLSAVSSMLAARSNVPSANERLVNFGSPSAPMDWVFGRVRKGGPYLMTTFRVARRYYAVALACHQIDGLEAWYLDQRPVTVTGSDGEVTSTPYAKSGSQPTVHLRLYTGALVQAADPRFVAAIPEWTEAHDMAGLAYVAVEARRVGEGRYYQLYGNSPQTGPAVAPVIRGANQVYDPRTDSYGYTRNAALIWAWLTVNWLGGTVDWTHVAAQADICDQVVLDRDGNPRPKWVLNGSIPDNADYETVRANVIAACDGYMFERPDGSLGLTVGGWSEPTITLTDDDFFTIAIQVRDWGPTAPTEFVAKYVNPNRDWTEAPSAVWVADPDAAENRREIPLPFVDSHNQAIRCLKRISAASRPEYTLTGEIGPIGYELIEHRFVRVQAMGLNFVAEIGRLARGESLAVLRIEAVSVTAEDFGFNATTEEPAPPPSNSLEIDASLPVPAMVIGEARTGLQILWTWPLQREDLRQEVQLRRSTDTDWPGGIILSEGTTEYVSTGHVEGVSYVARLRNITPANRASDWVESDAVMAVSSLFPPADPVSLQVSLLSPTEVEILVRLPNDPTATGVRIYRQDGGSPSFGSAVLTGTLYAAANSWVGTQQTLAAGFHHYWAVTINAAGTPSDPLGPETIETY